MRRHVVVARTGFQWLRVTFVFQKGLVRTNWDYRPPKYTQNSSRGNLNAMLLAALLIALSGCDFDVTPQTSPAQRCAAMCADAGLVVANFETGWECRCMTPLLRCDAAWNRADIALEQLAVCQTSLHECGSKSRGGGL